MAFFFGFSFLCEGKKAHNFRWTLTRVLSVAKTEPSTAHRRPHHCQTTSSRNRKKKQKQEKKKKSHWTYSRQKITSPSKCICEKQISHIWMKFLWCSCVFVVDIFYKLHCYCIYRCSSVFKCASWWGGLNAFVLVAVSAIHQCFPSIIHQGSMNHWASWDHFLKIHYWMPPSAFEYTCTGAEQRCFLLHSCGLRGQSVPLGFCFTFQQEIRSAFVILEI